MTDRERTVKRMKRLIENADDENYDFVYLNVGTARTIVRLLEEQERGGSAYGKPQPDENPDRV